MPALNQKSDAENAADIVRDAGGEVVGKTRLQKMAYLLEIAGLGSGFCFEYRHYGPFSEDLANAVTEAQFSDLLAEEEHPTSWGGAYSIFRFLTPAAQPSGASEARKQILSVGAKANPVSLELAATAAYLALEGQSDPWTETQRRKPEKAKKNLSDAKRLYAELKLIKTPKALPNL